MKPHAAALFALLGIALAAGLPAEPRKAITQGEFAVLFVNFLKIDPHRDWKPEDAVKTLGEDLGIEPLEGWKQDEPLTEGDLVALIRPARMPVLSPDPDRVVTLVEARAVLHRIEQLYRSSFVPNRTPGGVPLTEAGGEGGHPARAGGKTK